MRSKFGQDLVTGLLFVGIGIAALIIGWDYPRGTPQRPGTGVLPAILAWCMMGSGGLLALKAIMAGDEPISAIAWRPFFLVTLGVTAFGLLIDDWGLVLTMIVSMSLCAWGSLETRWPEFALFMVIMIAIGAGMFIWLLGMPINMWPTKAIPSFLVPILR